jgi:6-phosphogluconolactonase/glucosamine-6-phosphate isomerase/deaminase
MKEGHIIYCGPVKINIVKDNSLMGKMTVDHITEVIKEKYLQNKIIVLWLMAAPSGFPFYQALIEKVKRDRFLRKIIKETHFFQFDDYPISRKSRKFSVTFRCLLENNLFIPLKNLGAELPYIHFLELTGTDKDKEITKAYKEELLNLRKENSYIFQLKGIGMDGHWGFHGAEIPLDMVPDMIEVPMNKQNIQQQRIDWPELFPRIEDVPKTAYTFNVNAFLLADEIIDNVPQPTKEYAVLATYGTDDIINEIPSSALKKHHNAQAYITEEVAKALIEFREGRCKNKDYKLSNTTLNRLRSLWKDDKNQTYSQQSIKVMEEVLRKLNIIV